MSALLTSIVCSLILNFTIFSIIKKITSSKINLSDLKRLTLLFLLAIIQTIFYCEDYNILYTIINYLSIIIFVKLIFKENMIKSIILTSLTFLMLMIADFINSMLIINFISYEDIRSIWYYRLISSTLVSVLCYLIILIPPMKKKCKYFVSRFTEKHIPTIFLFIVLIVSIILITYSMSNKFKLDISYFANIFIILTLIVFCYIFINENNQYNKLNDEYDNLFKCIQTFEDWIEKEQLNRHEYKNQLAVLRCMTKEKKVKDKIDNIISDNININNATINQLKSIPSGGLKGLLYYKFVIAEKSKINLEIDISLNNKNILYKLVEEKMKIVCSLIGIYFDNAIEAAKETRKKIVSLEVYEYDDTVNIVISNTFKKGTNISKRNEKGITTKGKGHGNGLYFAHKMLNNNERIQEEQNIIDNFYTQKIIIKKNNTKLK